jgi:hypothetical protein
MQFLAAICQPFNILAQNALRLVHVRFDLVYSVKWHILAVSFLFETKQIENEENLANLSIIIIIKLFEIFIINCFDGQCGREFGIESERQRRMNAPLILRFKFRFDFLQKLKRFILIKSIFRHAKVNYRIVINVIEIETAHGRARSLIVEYKITELDEYITKLN